MISTFRKMFGPLMLLTCIGFTGEGLYAQPVNADSYKSVVWSPDNNDGTYKNPVLYADYSDPDICRAGSGYYLTASSFNCVPALPILYSADLVNWRIIGYAIDKLQPAEVYNKPQHGNGVYAPSIRFHKGEFYIYYGDPDYGIFMVKTKNPAGKWDDPVLVKEGKGLIDPCPLWDDDGKVYLAHAYAASRSGLKSVLVMNEMNAAGTKIIAPEVLVFDGHANHPVIEGPKLYKRNGYYYIFAPGGGVKYGWQTVLRSKSVYGPYEDKKVLQQGSTNINGPHQGAWVADEKGESWFVHFQDLDAYGRVMHLQPMKWNGDWPVMGIDNNADGIGEPVYTHKKPYTAKKIARENPAESDEFNSNRLGLQWQWHANPQHHWAFPSGSLGFLRLNCRPYPEGYKNLWNAPNLLLQKFPAPVFQVSTRFKFNSFPIAGDSDKFGLVVMGYDYGYIAVEKLNGKLVISQVYCKGAQSGGVETVNESIPVEQAELYFRVSVTTGGVCAFSYSLNGSDYIPAGKPFTALQGKWIGAKTGLFALRKGNTADNGFADVDWFRVHQ